jgi:hypothetical protein
VTCYPFKWRWKFNGIALNIMVGRASKGIPTLEPQPQPKQFQEMSKFKYHVR